MCTQVSKRVTTAKDAFLSPLAFHDGPAQLAHTRRWAFGVNVSITTTPAAAGPDGCSTRHFVHPT